jgi:hypothetical protein
MSQGKRKEEEREGEQKVREEKKRQGPSNNSWPATDTNRD